MDVSVVRQESSKREEFEFQASVVQRNRNPSALPEVRCIRRGSMFGTWVPACIAGISNQVGGGAFEELVKSYENGILCAVESGATVIEVEQFGVGSGRRIKAGGGKHRYDFGLHWKSPQSAMAAKEAIKRVAEAAINTIIVFTVPDAHFDEWDHVMKF